MLITAELRCISCGRLLATAEGESTRPLAAAALSCPTGDICLVGLDTPQPRCARCGGRAVLEEVRLVIARRA